MATFIITETAHKLLAMQIIKRIYCMGGYEVGNVFVHSEKSSWGIIKGGHY